MKRSSGRSLLALSLILSAVACGPSGGDDDDDPASACDGNLIPGDLVVTEVMANPVGDDDGNEWFELYNASSAAVDLGGLALVVAKADGTDEASHVLGELVIDAGDYLVVGDVLPELKPAWVDYGYANALGSLVNGGGRIALRCGDAEIDGFEYPAAPGSNGGVTTILDGNVVPDHLANDEAANLCASTTPFAGAAGVIGSPGDANEACDVLVPGACDDGGEMRPTVAPEVGDLVISEIMSSPDVVADADGEWFEVHVKRTVDLNGVVAGRTVGTAQASISSATCVTAAAGSHILFARRADPAINGGLPQVDATFNFSLVGGSADSPGTIFVGLGDAVLDQVSWTDSENGASTALAPDQLDVTANDEAANFATCEAPYGADGNTGTPREANDTCSTPAGMCDDGGTLRAIVPPTAGQIRVTEAMPDPMAVGDTAGEWFEIEVSADVDLNGLELGKVRDPYTVLQTVTATACLEVGAGARVVFARVLDPALNGGLPADARALPFGLSNSNDAVFVGHAGAALSHLGWTTVRAGVARALAPDGLEVCDAPADATYGAGDKGTPGDANPTSTTSCAAPLP